ncbi:MAG: hypothetical protein K2N84_01775 [Clostridia bacterium]|nr:hypothetical protein [Clostridia bacterium]
MKKYLKAITIGLLAGSLTLGAVGCNDTDNPGPDNKKYFNNETDPLRFTTLEVDGVFSPFFSTSGTDSNVVGMTQLSMLANDAAGNPSYGDDEACVVKDLEIIQTGTEDVDLKTEYRFVLKNNLKFSDGKPLTMKDVLFNFYVYLDIAYTGSSTIYSTDIVGLKEYRTQAATDKEQESFMQRFEVAAEARINALVMTADEIFDEHDNELMNAADFRGYLQAKQDATQNDTYKNLVADYDQALKLFKEELESDYSGSLNSYEDTKFTDKSGKVYEGLFTTDVESFLYNEGYITWNKRDGKLESALTNNLSDFKNPAKWDKDKAIDAIVSDKIPYDIAEVVQYWNTAVTLNTYLTNAELQKYSETHERKYQDISGIKFANGGAARGGADSVKVNDVTYDKPEYAADGSVSAGYEVLSITINDIDPKAIWNFAIPVAPMHYYSDAEHVAAFDYVANFGVEWGNQDFLNNVVNAPSKMGVPVGAGPYMASKESGGTDDIKPSDFKSANVIYFERNPHYLMGPAKIKMVRFVVVTSTSMLNNLKGGRVDFAEPNAKPETITELEKEANLGHKSITTSGYGYIGINAGKVPALAIRQAIMYSIDTSLCVEYYKTGAQQIHRSMSTSSWAYPKGCTAYYPYIGGPVPANLDVVDPQYKAFVNRKGKKAGEKFSKAEQQEFIKYLVEDVADYSPNASGVYAKGSNVCKYTFTIAGEGNDHPAWTALFQAGEFLNEIGFNITVKPDSNALRKLSTGDLTVWAAAWGSTIDPDMYQVYHMDSKASSVNNWGYPQIILNAGGRYDDELETLGKLAVWIEKARSTNNQEERAEMYSKALDLVMQLAVELPTYQRDDLFAYDKTRIDESTFNQETSSFKGLTSDMHLISLVTEK